MTAIRNPEILHLKARYTIGHPAYPHGSANAFKTFGTRRYALRELVRRGVDPDAAAECLAAADTGLWGNILAYAKHYHVVEVRRVA